MILELQDHRPSRSTQISNASHPRILQALKRFHSDRHRGPQPWHPAPVVPAKAAPRRLGSPLNQVVNIMQAAVLRQGASQNASRTSIPAVEVEEIALCVSNPEQVLREEIPRRLAGQVAYQ